MLWLLSMVSAIFEIPPMNTTFEAGGRLIEKVVKNDRHYIMFLRSFDDDEIKLINKKNDPKYD